MQRRQFLKWMGAGSLSLALPDFGWGAPAHPKLEKRILILVELNGGNDGLNTLIPYRDPAYQELRPQLAISSDQVLKISPSLGFHPALEPLMPLWKRGKMAVIRGVGYPQPNRSHFRSIDIWETASGSEEYLSRGWISRAFAKLDLEMPRIAEGVVLGGSDPGPLFGEKLRTIVMRDPKQIVRQASRLNRASAKTENSALAHILRTRAHLLEASDELKAKVRAQGAGQALKGVDFPQGVFGRSLQGLVQVLAAGVRAPVFKLSLGSFDTHAGQLGMHQRLLGELAGGLAALEKALTQLGLFEDTLVVTYSEFGRRPRQNASNGTDHGTAAPHFWMGGRVRGGLYGRQPSLTDLDSGDLKFHVDFRDLYQTIGSSWWGIQGQFLPSRKGFVLPILT